MRRQCGRYSPQSVLGSVAGKDAFCFSEHPKVGFSEGNNAIGITKLSNGQQRVGRKCWDDVCIGCRVG